MPKHPLDDTVRRAVHTGYPKQWEYTAATPLPKREHVVVEAVAPDDPVLRQVAGPAHLDRYCYSFSPWRADSQNYEHFAKTTRGGIWDDETHVRPVRIGGHYGFLNRNLQDWCIGCDMVQAMQFWRCRSLAAPQIGISRRIIAVLDMDGEGIATSSSVYLNPVIVAESDFLVGGAERCHSLPGRTRFRMRPESLVLQWDGYGDWDWDIYNWNLPAMRGGMTEEDFGCWSHDDIEILKRREQEFRGAEARAIRHAVDHLDGILITDPQAFD